MKYSCSNVISASHYKTVSRQAVKRNLLMQCKCHGVSGSCTMKTCWKVLPTFQTIGDYLMQRYMRAKKVTPYWGKRSANLRPLFLKYFSERARNRSRRSQRPKQRDLIYLDNSPNYCDRNPTLGSLGTRGRICNRTSQGIDGCDLLCCGRGYNTHEYVKNWQCQCKFHFCCYVDCKKCLEKIELHTCK